MPTTCCCVPKCSKRGGHHFPSDEATRKLWVIAIKRENWTPSKYSVVCFDHFTNDDYATWTYYGCRPLKRTLKKNAVPSRFPWSVKPTPCNIVRNACVHVRQRSGKAADSPKMFSSVKFDIGADKIEVDSQLLENAKVVENNDQLELHFGAFGVKKVQSNEEHTVPNSWDNLGCKRQSISSVKVCFVEKRYKCSFCSVLLTNITDVTKHMVNHCEQIQLELNKSSDDSEDTLSATSEEPQFENIELPRTTQPEGDQTFSSVEHELKTEQVEQVPCSNTRGNDCAVVSAKSTTGHRRKIADTSTKNESTEEKNSTPAAINYKCMFCTVVLYSVADLTKHIAVHSGQIQSMVTNRRGQTESKSSSKAEKQRTECETCGATFKSNSSLQIHMYYHTKRHPCNRCPRVFECEKSLADHKSSHANEPSPNGLHHRSRYNYNREKKYHCDKCEEKFFFKFDLQVHQSSRHVVKDVYKCDICESSFDSQTKFRMHKVTHVEQTFNCGYCEDKFKTREKYRKHVVTHKTCICEVCGLGFYNTSMLNIHMRTHTGERPYTCEYCAKTFRVLHYLNKHILVHTGEKPHKCDICGKCFRIAYQLKIHVATHTGEKPFECQVCGKRFIQKVNYKSHVKIHTKEKDPASTVQRHSGQRAEESVEKPVTSST